MIVEGLINATSVAPAPVPHRPSALMPIRSIKTQRESCGKRRRSYGRWTLSEMVRDIRPRTTGAATRPQCEKKSFRSEYAFAKKEGRSSAPRSHRRARRPFLALSLSRSLTHSSHVPSILDTLSRCQMAYNTSRSGMFFQLTGTKAPRPTSERANERVGGRRRRGGSAGVGVLGCKDLPPPPPLFPR